MNQDIFAGQWKQMRGTLKAWWGKLTDSDFDRIGGQTDKLIGLVQERYGYVREQAQHEVERRMKEYGDKMDSRSGSGMPEAAGAVASMTAKAQELGATDASKVGEAATAVGEQMGSLASAIRDNAPHDGAIATAATAVAGGWNRRARTCTRKTTQIWPPTSPPWCAATPSNRYWLGLAWAIGWPAARKGKP